jgi:quercetin dioxygenase-like cupin family protein
MQIIRWSEKPEIDTPHHVSARKLLESQHASVVFLDFQPGETLKLHITPVDALFYVVRGRGECKIGDEVEAVQAGDLVFSPAKVPHLLRSTGEAFQVLVIKVPAPTTATQVL